MYEYLFFCKEFGVAIHERRLELMFRLILKTLGILAIALPLSVGFLASSPALAYAASQPGQANPQTALASANLPVASAPAGEGVCLPSGYNLNGWRCGWRLAIAPYNLGGYYGGYSGGYYEPSYGSAYEPNYCAPDGDGDVDDWTCNGYYGGYAAPVYRPFYYNYGYMYGPFYRPFFFRRMR